MMNGSGTNCCIDAILQNKKYNKTIGICMPEKKSQKFNWNELAKVCGSHGYNLIKVDVQRPLEEQGQMDVFVHKLKDLASKAARGDLKASVIMNRVEQYLSNHPNIVVIDPLDNMRILINRSNYYTILANEPSFKKQGIFTPAFAEFTSSNIEQNFEIMKERGVTFPVICKSTEADGSKTSHNMIAIFNKKGLGVCKPPCVVQSFINHNAVLHKVFLVGNRYHICRRPSLKNFYASEDLSPIFYTTGEVCKADSQSTLSILDPHDKPDITMTLNEEKVRSIINVLRKEIGLVLAGFDVVIDNVTGDHAVIDINLFPSYDDFPDVFEHLLDCIDDMVCTTLSHCNVDSNGVSDYLTNDLINVAFIPTRHGVTGMNINSNGR